LITSVVLSPRIANASALGKPENEGVPIVPTMISIVRLSVIGALDMTLVLDVLLLAFRSTGLADATTAVARRRAFRAAR
jgi:hypothetical protein